MARLDPVNKPELLPAEFTTVIDVAGFLTPREEAEIAKKIAALEKDTGFKLRVLAQNYPETPGLAIRYSTLGHFLSPHKPHRVSRVSRLLRLRAVGGPCTLHSLTPFARTSHQRGVALASTSASTAGLGSSRPLTKRTDLLLVPATCERLPYADTFDAGSVAPSEPMLHCMLLAVHSPSRRGGGASACVCVCVCVGR